ncbi:hypothetical protein AVEN_159337-1 [Araneus ventricosus]|uniref:Uncharacterized protein n=1 Tax=Araneus ventricosus TaxID=182803 RepID=A0A4Y2A0W0_ARAVE|nr:hypothetical protein AVEN_159337-1 [Araneus ventricosus]
MEAGQEEMRSGHEQMRSGQERIEKGQVEMKGMIDEVKVFKTVSSTKVWTDCVKANQLVALLRESAAQDLQGIPDDKLTDLMTIEKALESGFGGSHLT